MMYSVRRVISLLLCLFFPLFVFAEIDEPLDSDHASTLDDLIAQQRAQIVDLRAALSQVQFNNINDKQARLSENQKMSGQISDLQKELADFKEREEQHWKSVDQRLSSLENKIRLFSTSIRQNENQDKEEHSPPVVGDLKPVPFDLESYDKALQKLRRGHYKEAISFLKLLQASASDQGERQADVNYWLGTSYYLLGDYKSAASFFKQVIRNWPHYARTPDALLNLSNSYYQMGDKESAKLAEKEILKGYPNSVAAQSLFKHLQ